MQVRSYVRCLHYPVIDWCLVETNTREAALVRATRSGTSKFGPTVDPFFPSQHNLADNPTKFHTFQTPRSLRLKVAQFLPDSTHATHK